MKMLRLLFLVFLVSLATAPVVYAQDLPGTAGEGVAWLIGQVDGWTAVVVGLVSSQLMKIAVAWLPDEVEEAVRKSVLVPVSLLVPAVLTWVFTSLIPVAGFLDAGGYWEVFLAVTGSQYGVYILEKLPKALVLLAVKPAATGNR